MVQRIIFFFFKQKTPYGWRISDWSSDVCSSDLPADRLLVAGGPREVEALRDNPHLIGADLAKVRAFRRGKAWIAILCMIAVVALAALDVLSIGVAAIIAIGVILVTRCIDSEEAWGTIDGDVLILIFAMLAVGLALEQSGRSEEEPSEITSLLRT